MDSVGEKPGNLLFNVMACMQHGFIVSVQVCQKQLLKLLVNLKIPYCTQCRQDKNLKLVHPRKYYQTCKSQFCNVNALSQCLLGHPSCTHFQSSHTPQLSLQTSTLLPSQLGSQLRNGQIATLVTLPDRKPNIVIYGLKESEKGASRYIRTKKDLDSPAHIEVIVPFPTALLTLRS